MPRRWELSAGESNEGIALQRRRFEYRCLRAAAEENTLAHLAESSFMQMCMASSRSRVIMTGLYPGSLSDLRQSGSKP